MPHLLVRDTFQNSVRLDYQSSRSHEEQFVLLYFDEWRFYKAPIYLYSYSWFTGSRPWLACGPVAQWYKKILRMTRQTNRWVPSSSQLKAWFVPTRNQFLLYILLPYVPLSGSKQPSSNIRSDMVASSCSVLHLLLRLDVYYYQLFLV